MREAAIDKLRVLGWVHVVFGGLGLLAGLLLIVLVARDPNGGEAMRYIAPLFLMLACVFLVPSLVGGLGLLRGQAWGRWLIGALSLLIVLAFPVGTLLGGFSLWALLTTKSQPPPVPGPAPSAQTAAPARTPTVMQPSPRRPPWGLLTAIVFVGAGFVAVIGAGFKIHDQIAPAVIDQAFYPAVVILVAVVAYVLIKRPFGRDRPLNPWKLHRYRQDLKRDAEQWKEQRRRRIAELAADPARARYAALMEAGQSWNDDEIAYDQDVNVLATCRHLQPIEHAMRLGGIAVKLVAPPQVRADCRVDEVALAEAFRLAPSVHYRAMFLGGRSEEDDPVAYLICEACQSTIDAVHPRLARAETPSFPGPPVGA